jgi:HAD superfamily hydrolase (TIGR01549 family)
MKNQEIAYNEWGKNFSKLTREGLHLLNRNVLDAMGIKRNVLTMDIIYEEFEKRRDGYKIFPDCKSTLEKIHGKGIKIGLLSNTDELHGQTRRSTMKKNGILHLFEAIILSSETSFEKPQKEIFDIALDAIGIRDGSKVMHVGDSRLADGFGAKNSGLIPILYDPQGFYSENEYITIKKLSEILNYLK